MGVGSLELARGEDHISMNGVVLEGERDIMGSTFNAAEMALLEAQAKSWSGGDWNAKTWKSPHSRFWPRKRRCPHRPSRSGFCPRS